MLHRVSVGATVALDLLRGQGSVRDRLHGEFGRDGRAVFRLRPVRERRGELVTPHGLTVDEFRAQARRDRDGGRDRAGERRHPVRLRVRGGCLRRRRDGVRDRRGRVLARNQVAEVFRNLAGSDWRVRHVRHLHGVCGPDSIELSGSAHTRTTIRAARARQRHSPGPLPPPEVGSSFGNRECRTSP